jgi:hypothetical protein
LINKLRKNEKSVEVAKLATDILVNWKKLVVEQPPKTDKTESSGSKRKSGSPSLGRKGIDWPGTVHYMLFQ